MTDIKIKRYADKENLKKLMRYIKATFANKIELASKANDSDVVHKSGDETVAGTKTFTSTIVGNVTGNASTATKLQTARTINGTSFNGTANITTANWGTARDITIADSTGDNTGEAVSVNGSAAVTLKLPATIKASLDGNAATATSATTAASATTATNATNAAKLGNIASSGYVQTGKVNQTIDGTKTFSAAIVGSVTGNAGSATKLATARTINGTVFDGTANITTANWGTARNISITDGTNTSTAVSVNGSANVSLNLPATIKANLTGNCSGSSGSCTGNAATATKATQDSDGNKITTTYSKNGHTHDDRYYTETEVNNLLKGKANDSDVVHKSGDETIAGTKTFSKPIVGSVTGSSGSCTGNAATATTATTAKACTGNAATATKLATTRTIALSGAATGTATAFDGSGNITIPVTSLDASKLSGLAAQMEALGYAAYPAGVIIPFAGTSVPTGYLLCNGAAVSRKNYANLFAAIGTLYGAGNGSTTFNLPDARDRVLQGASGWHSAGSYIAAGLPNITGTLYQGAACAAIQTADGAFYTNKATNHAAQQFDSTIFGEDIRFDASRASKIYGASSTVQSPAIATNFIIKY